MMLQLLILGIYLHYTRRLMKDYWKSLKVKSYMIFSF